MEICQGCNQYVATAHLFFDYDGELRRIACLDNKEKEEMIDNAGIERSIKVNPETLEEIKLVLTEALDPYAGCRESQLDTLKPKFGDTRLAYIRTALRLVNSLLVIA